MVGVVGTARAHMNCGEARLAECMSSALALIGSTGCILRLGFEEARCGLRWSKE